MTEGWLAGCPCPEGHPSPAARELPSRGAFTATVSVQKTPGESLMFLYEIDELYDFAVSELAIPIKMV